MVSNISPVYAGTQALRSAGSLNGANDAKSFEKQFFKLLIAQMTNQDPFNAENQGDFLGQMAQFESLSQATKTNDNLEAMLFSQQLGQNSSLIGKYVEADTGDEVVTGVVSSLRVVDGKYLLVIGNQTVELSQITKVWENDGTQN